MIKQDLQLTMEQNYAKQHVDAALEKFLLDHYKDVVDQAAGFIHQWLAEVRDTCLSPKKVERLAFLDDFQPFELAKKLLVRAMYCTKPELFTSVTAQTAAYLNFSDKADAIQTCAELFAVIAHTGAYNIYKQDKKDSLYITSNFQLSEQIQRYISNVIFTPPMAVVPQLLHDNNCSPYLVTKDKLILGKGNHHDAEISLDVLNKLNSVELSLNLQFLCTVEEIPKSPWETPEQQEQWDQFKKESYHLYEIVAKQYGNSFYLPNSVDKRGRIYARGYHITTQGTSFKKASIDFAKKEVVTGIPNF